MGLGKPRPGGGYYPITPYKGSWADTVNKTPLPTKPDHSITIKLSAKEQKN